MKKTILKYLLLSASLFCTFACSDNFLEIKPRGKEIASTYEHYNGMLNTFNLTLYGAMGQTAYSFYMSDEFTATEESLNNLLLYTQDGGPAAYRYESNYMKPEETTTEWGFGQNIYTYNVIIRDVMNAEGGTDEEKLSVYSEARVMRAWLHFTTAQYFCKPYNESTAATDKGLPLATSSNTMDEKFEMRSVKDLYDFIVTEMEESVPHIQNRTNYTFRCEKSDAYTMLGMIYYYMNKYDKALAAFRQAKTYADENGSSFLYNYNDYDDEWVNNSHPMHYEHKEYMRDLEFSNLHIMYFPFYVPEPIIYVKDEYINKFSAGDRRLARFAKVDGEEFYRPIISYFTMGPTSADLYTMLAECEAREGDANAARALLVEFRKRRMPESEAEIPSSVASKEDLVKFAIDEHIREWMGTGKIWWDMRRLWNDSYYAAEKAKFGHSVGSQTYIPQLDNLVLPIPQQVADWHPEWND